MFIGMWTRRKNERRLAAIENAIERAKVVGDLETAAELEVYRQELLASGPRWSALRPWRSIRSRPA